MFGEVLLGWAILGEFENCSIIDSQILYGLVIENRRNCKFYCFSYYDSSDPHLAMTYLH